MNDSIKNLENRIKSFKLKDCYDFSNSTRAQKANFNIQSTQNREEQDSKLSVEENVLKDGKKTLKKNEFKDDDNLKNPMFPSLTSQHIGSGFEDNMKVLQPSPSMQLLDHVFQALIQPKTTFTQLPKKFMGTTEERLLEVSHNLDKQAGNEDGVKAQPEMNTCCKSCSVKPCLCKALNETNQCCCCYTQCNGPFSIYDFNPKHKPLCNFDFDEQTFVLGFSKTGNDEKSMQLLCENTENQKFFNFSNQKKQTLKNIAQRNKQGSNRKGLKLVSSDQEHEEIDKKFARSFENEQPNGDRKPIEKQDEEGEHDELEKEKKKSLTNFQKKQSKNINGQVDLFEDWGTGFFSKNEQNNKRSKRENMKNIRSENVNESANDQSKSWRVCQCYEEDNQVPETNKKPSCCCCFCFTKKNSKNCLNDVTTTSQNELLTLQQQQDFLQQQLQQIMQQYQKKLNIAAPSIDRERSDCLITTDSDECDYDNLLILQRQQDCLEQQLQQIMQQYRKKLNIDVPSIDTERCNCSESTDSDDCDYDKLINALEVIIVKHKKKKLLKRKCEKKSSISAMRELPLGRISNKKNYSTEKLKEKKSRKSKKKFSENLEKNSQLKLIKIKKLKVSNVVKPEIESGLENDSTYTLKNNQSRATYVSELTLAEKHSNLSINDQSRMLIEDQSRISRTFVKKELKIEKIPYKNQDSNKKFKKKTSKNSKTKLDENLEKNSHFESVKINKLKVNKVARPESQSVLETKSYSTLKTNVDELTLAEIHSNISLKDQSRKSLENQSRMSIKDQSRKSLENQSRMSIKDQSRKSIENQSTKSIRNQSRISKTSIKIELNRGRIPSKKKHSTKKLEKKTSKNSKTKLSEKSKKNAPLKSVTIKKRKVSNITTPGSQKGLTNGSFFSSKVIQSKVTNASRLTVAETHSNMRSNDQSRKSLEYQSGMSIQHQSRKSLLRAELPSNISLRYQSKKFGKNSSNRRSEAKKVVKYKSFSKSNNGETLINSKKSKNKSKYSDKLFSNSDIFENDKNVLSHKKKTVMNGVSIESEVIENKFDNGNQSKIREVGKIRKEPGSKKLTQLQKYGAENKVDKKINQKYIDDENEKMENEGKCYTKPLKSYGESNDKKNYEYLRGLENRTFHHVKRNINSVSDKVNSESERDDFEDRSNHIGMKNNGSIEKVIKNMKIIFENIQRKKSRNPVTHERYKIFGNKKKIKLSGNKIGPDNHYETEKKQNENLKKIERKKEKYELSKPKNNEVETFGKILFDKLKNGNGNFDKVTKEKINIKKLKTEMNSLKTMKQDKNESKTKKFTEKLIETQQNKPFHGFDVSKLKKRPRKEKPTQQQTDENTCKNKLEKHLLMVEDLTFRKIGLFEDAY